MNNLIYLNNILKEVLRVYPIIPNVHRTATKNATVPEGPSLKEGTTITTFIPALHYSETNFPDPYKFKPERYDKQGKHYLYQLLGRK